MAYSPLVQSVNLPENRFVVQPASMIQRQFWLINQFDKKSTAYNIPSVFMLEGALNIPALEESINEIIRRHETLRTNFINEHVGLIQKIFSSRMLRRSEEHTSELQSQR